MFRLNDEQAYVERIADYLDIDTEIVHHPRSTITCYEKAELLAWDPNRVIKTLYFSNGETYVGVIIPELGDESPKMRTLLKESLSLSRKKAEKYYLNGTPDGMTKGTCTPFPYETLMSNDISKLIIYDYPEISNIVTDISLGGVCDEAKKVSMHIPYMGIYSILKEKFKEDIILYSKLES